MVVERIDLQKGDVVDFGAYRLMAKAGSCTHRRAEIDPEGGTLKCMDCGDALAPFVFLVSMMERRKAVLDAIEHQRLRIGELFQKVRAYRPHLRAAKAMEELWRAKLAPCCPHCRRPILTEDVTDQGLAAMSAELERRRREVEGR